MWVSPLPRGPANLLCVAPLQTRAVEAALLLLSVHSVTQLSTKKLGYSASKIPTFRYLGMSGNIYLGHDGQIIDGLCTFGTGYYSGMLVF